MYWHGSLQNTRRPVEKIVADRAKGILVITGIGSTPCPLEGLRYVGRYLWEPGTPPLTVQEEGLTKGTSCPSHCPMSGAS